MSIRPVDLQVSVPRTSEMSKLHNDQLQKNLSAQQLQASRLQTEAEHNTRLVYKKDDLDEVIIRQKQGKEQQGNRKNKQNKDGNPEKRHNDSFKGSTIDIRL